MTRGKVLYEYDGLLTGGLVVASDELELVSSVLLEEESPVSLLSKSGVFVVSTLMSFSASDLDAVEESSCGSALFNTNGVNVCTEQKQNNVIKNENNARISSGAVLIFDLHGGKNVALCHAGDFHALSLFCHAVSLYVTLCPAARHIK